MPKLLCLFFCLSFSLLNAQKIQDKDLTDTQIDFLLGLDDWVGINYADEGIKGFYNHFRKKKHIRIHGNTDATDDYYNYTNDVSLLATLPDLETLRFSDCSTTDFSVLKKAPKLKTLDISYHQGLINLASIFEITQLENLILLDIKEVNTSSIKGIENLSRLKKLSLQSVSITDLSSISNITSGIKEINIERSNIEKIGDLSLLTDLHTFSFYSSGLENTNFIKNNKNLEYLTINGSHINTINLSTTKLKWLSIAHSNISDLGNIKALSNLETLSLEHNQISNIDDLKYLKKLKYLNLNNNNIAEACSLNENLNLETLEISENPVNNLSCLSQLPNLKKLTAEFTCYCNPTNVDELKSGVHCNIFDKVVIFILDKILYAIIGVLLLFYIFYKKNKKLV